MSMLSGTIRKLLGRSEGREALLVKEPPDARGIGEHAMVIKQFQDLMAVKKAPSVLELGTKRSQAERCTMHRDWVPHAGEFVGSDFDAGLDVDVVADVHKLSDVFGENRFDAIVSCSVFEHVQYPWVAVVELCRVLKQGGLVFVQTHQAFPLHAYPFDYWRFSTGALKTLFSEQVGFRVIGAEYVFRAKIVSERDPAAANYPSYLNVHVLAEKIAHPPADFQWQPHLQAMP